MCKSLIEVENLEQQAYTDCTKDFIHGANFFLYFTEAVGGRDTTTMIGGDIINSQFEMRLNF